MELRSPCRSAGHCRVLEKGEPVASGCPKAFEVLFAAFFMSHRAVNHTWRLLSFALQTRAVAFTRMLSQQVKAKVQRARGVKRSSDLPAIISGPLCAPFRDLSCHNTCLSGAKSLSPR